MKIEEFTEIKNEIENFYKKKISEEEKKRWYEEFKQMDTKRFKYIIAQAYRTLKFIPKLADIIEINANLGYSPVKKEEETIKCNKCRGTGYILYQKEIKNGEEKMKNSYMAICSCGKQKQYKGWEISDERHRTNYYIPLAVELGL